MCDRRELDVFLTAHHEVDEVMVETVDGIFCMQSVRYEPDGTAHDITIVDRATTWLAPTKVYQTSAASAQLASLLKVGDRIRLGDTRHWNGLAGHLDYVTILEIKGPIRHVYNGVGAPINIGQPGATLAFDAASDSNSRVDVSSGTGAVYCYRVSAPVNATVLPNSIKEHPISSGRDNNNTITYGNRLSEYTNGFLWADIHGAVPYPVYKASFQGVGKAAEQSHLTLKLDSGVKHVHEIKLVGYQLTSKDSPIAGTYVGSGESSTFQEFLILRLKEVPGRVLSNNTHANGALAIIPTGSQHSACGTRDGLTEHERYEPKGLASVAINRPTPIKHLTVELLDRHGEPAPVSKLNLWFKVIASHG